MNVDAILETIERHRVDAILIGGMNFLLRHQPVLTYDVDFWVRDTEENLSRLVSGLRELEAEWGRDEASWAPIPETTQWLKSQAVFCLTTKYGAVDIFRELRGLEGQYEVCFNRAQLAVTTNGIAYRSLSDRDMLACQLALPEAERRLDRVTYLKKYLEEQP